VSGRVAGKRVLVTGAARGMGRSHAVRLAEEGADLILIDLCESLPGLEYPLASREDLEETAELVRKQGRRAVTRIADVRDANAMRDAVAEGAAELGGLEASVANAGVSTAGTWDTTTAAQWRLVLDVNLIGSWNTCAAGIKGTPLSTPYTASKHGVVGMSLALANELAARNIRVNTVHPTGVPTGMLPGLHPLLASERPDLAPIYANALPVQLVDARDVSNAVLFLVSDESRHVTGLEFKVDAGLTIR
jgi:NAD(P)-dependent dehydrogenase (short-subunit alcohol dehydrogenase family)